MPLIATPTPFNRPRACLVLLLCAATLTIACAEDSSSEVADATGGQLADAAPQSDSGADEAMAADSDVEPDPTRVCTDVCQTSDDCHPDYECLDTGCFQRNTELVLRCEEDADCLPAISGWLTLCSAELACPSTSVCIEHQGRQVCAFAAERFNDCTASFDGFEPLPAISIEGEAVQVCGNTRSECAGGLCTFPCRNDDDCGPSEPHCNRETRDCECDATSCDAFAPVCTDRKKCECVTDSDCTLPGRDTCYNGFCGCSSTSVCEISDQHPNVTPLCAPRWQ
jgi:hypothetical protein